MNILVADTPIKTHSRTDRIGIVASILCAIHCALTPVLLIALPTFGKAWAHPSTHWGMAIIVIPIAIFMMKKGYQKHRKKWVVATGTVGVALIIVGAILPYVEKSPTTEVTQVKTDQPIQDEISSSPEETENCVNEASG